MKIVKSGWMQADTIGRVGKSLHARIQKRPWTLPLLLAPIPLGVSLIGIAVELGSGPAAERAAQPVQGAAPGAATWPMILRPALISGLLVGLFAWLAVSLPTSAVLKPRKMTQKRAVSAIASFLTSGALWSGIILGDVAWRLALFGPEGLQGAGSLEISPWIYFAAVTGTGALLYWFVRPRTRRR